MFFPVTIGFPGTVDLLCHLLVWSRALGELGIKCIFRVFFLQLCFSLPVVGYHSPSPLCHELCLLQSGPCLIKGDSFPVVTVEAAINSISISPFICFLKPSP